MDFEQENQITGSIPENQQSGRQLENKPKKRGFWKILWGIFTGLSVLANVLLFFMLVAIIAAFATRRQGDFFTEEVIQAGTRTNKIAVINLDGFIDSQKAKDIAHQIKTASRDNSVKGLILRVYSPGGMVSSSDQIYREILRYREREGKPVVAFMQGVGASGAYYASVACNEIMAEPTTITGSIGVIANYFVFQQLLEEKLGIQPVVVKSGEKKDWPSAFRPPSDEQKQYLMDKLIKPVYERFVKIIADGRNALTLDQVKKLADGSIYNAIEALDKHLIDNIGYIEDAIDAVCALADIKKPHVIEYKKPFSLSQFLTSTSKTNLKVDKKTLYEFGTPELLYLWNGN